MLARAQVFVLNGTKGSANYTYLQDLANLNMPAGSSVQFGASSLISADGSTVAVGTAAATNTVFKMVYMYRRDTFTGRFRIVSSIADGEYFADPWGALTGVGITDDNALSMTQSGRFVLRVENSMLVIYEWSGSGMTMTWKRRCQLSAPDGYTFRTSARACAETGLPSHVHAAARTSLPLLLRSDVAALLDHAAVAQLVAA